MAYSTLSEHSVIFFIVLYLVRFSFSDSLCCSTSLVLLRVIQD